MCNTYIMCIIFFSQFYILFSYIISYYTYYIILDTLDRDVITLYIRYIKFLLEFLLSNKIYYIIYS